MVVERVNNQMSEKMLLGFFFQFCCTSSIWVSCHLNQLLRTVTPVHDYPFLTHLRLKFLQSLKVLFFEAPVTCNDLLFNFLQKSSSVMTNKCMILCIPTPFMNGFHFSSLN